VTVGAVYLLLGLTVWIIGESDGGSGDGGSGLSCFIALYHAMDRLCRI